VASTIQQELLYVGDESGKLLAIRDIIRKVNFSLNCFRPLLSNIRPINNLAATKSFGDLT